MKLARITGIRAPVFLPPALPSAGLFPVELVIASTASHDELVRFADQLVAAATASGQFAFPPILDVRIDQANAELVIDRDKVASMGQTMQQIGADLVAILGGNFVNRFNLDGRSYKVIPQIERAGRLTPEQLTEHPRLGPERAAGAAGADRDAPHERRAAVAQSPPAAQRDQDLGASPTRSLDGALKVLEDTAAKILPPGYRVDYTGESRQLRRSRGKFLPAMGLALLLIFLVLAAQFNSFRDPFVILAGSVPLAMFGALIFTFLKFAGPPACTSGSPRAGPRRSTSTRRSAW